VTSVDIMQGLNVQQVEAVRHADGPLLIIAGAGTGKTSVLTRRIAYLISEHKVAPWSILAITFTNKAAREMKERVERLVGPSAADIWISTFHAMCVRVLRRDIEKLGYAASFTILDATDQLTVVKQSLNALNIDPKKFEPRAILGAISQAKNELKGADSVAKSASTLFEEVVADVYKTYQKRLRANNSLDFDDLIMKTVELFEQHPDVLKFYHNKFHYIHVDENQDTNHSQYRLVRLLSDKRRQLCVVGDSDQSIYRWRGADIQNILNFEHDYSETTIIKLEQNYRSTMSILDAANGVIENNSQRKEKRLWSDKPTGDKVQLARLFDERSEAMYVAGQLQAYVEGGGRYADSAILYRTNAQSRVMEEVLLKSNIPYRIVGGIKFYDRKEIRDVLAYLRLIVNMNDDISFRRIINVPKRGIGDSSLGRLEQYASDSGISLFTALLEVDFIDLPHKITRTMADFAIMIRNLATMRQYLSITELTEQMLSMTSYEDELKKERTIEAETRLENIAEFLSVTKEFDAREAVDQSMALSEFLTDVTLVADVADTEEQAEGVILMTLHSAKGLEFPLVFLLGLEEGVFPHSRSLDSAEEMEEERRLCYVGITRAMERLFVTTCATRTLFGQTKTNAPSRFLQEVPSDLIEEAVVFTQGTRTPLRGYESAQFRDERGYDKTVASERSKWHSESIMGGSLQLGATKSTDAPLGFAPPKFGADLSLDWRTGDKVLHRKWGAGTIVTTSGSGEDLELTVAFPTPTGLRKLLAKFAPITKG